MTLTEVADFAEERGDSWTKELQFISEGTPANITDWTVYFTLKDSRQQADADAPISKTITNHEAPRDGRTTISLTAAETASLAGDYVYSLKVERSGGEVSTLLEGDFSIEQSVTTRPN
jgi:hypothetical protein